jgi:hypothetical protein
MRVRIIVVELSSNYELPGACSNQEVIEEPTMRLYYCSGSCGQMIDYRLLKYDILESRPSLEYTVWFVPRVERVVPQVRHSRLTSCRSVAASCSGCPSVPVTLIT